MKYIFRVHQTIHERFNDFPEHAVSKGSQREGGRVKMDSSLFRLTNGV